MSRHLLTQPQLSSLLRAGQDSSREPSSDPDVEPVLSSEMEGLSELVAAVNQRIEHYSGQMQAVRLRGLLLRSSYDD